MTHDLDDLLALALDPDGPEAPRREAEASLAAHAEGRRLLAEHRALWSALGELETPRGALSDEHFTDEVSRRAQRLERHAARTRLLRGASPALAASLLVIVGSLAWFGHRAWVHRDDQLVHFLHLVENIELVETHAQALDLRNDYEVRRAFAGELSER
ncbi:MAG: hypothetical protein DHS20C15_18410 [Planctomycetota bacterium]|nr:MAG: hypothetical protein DHS20C15_18410 [Planctomycetota bacterium]